MKAIKALHLRQEQKSIQKGIGHTLLKAYKFNIKC